MEFATFIDRANYLDRLRRALKREKPQFIVLYGRRRIGKSTLVKQIIDESQGDIYFLSDQTNETNQRSLFAQTAAFAIEGFDDAVYPDWETLFRSLNRQTTLRRIVCLDEFPYMVKSCPSLPSVIQKLLNEKTLKFDLILCGSSQQLMQGYVLDKKEPLYGLADEIIKLSPIPPKFIGEALGCDAREAVEEYAVWGGIPRYWELRADYPDRDSAMRALLLDPKGFLADEPIRLLRDDMRDTVQASTLLSIIGNGANKLSEIAARAGKDAPQITDALGKLRELGYIRREIPFGEDEKKSRKGIYRINDNLLAFNYRFVAPYKSLLEMGRVDTIASIVTAQFPQFAGDCWEHLCRQHVSGNIVDGIAYGMASRWWGKVFPEGDKEGEMTELDVVAESFDKRHLLIGECKWTNKENVPLLMDSLAKKAALLPFVKQDQEIHLALFLKQEPGKRNGNRIFLPEDVIQ